MRQVSSALPPDFPEDGFSHDAFEALLREFVDPDGRIDYARWHADADARAKLDAYLAAIAAYGPDRDPQRFPTPADRTAYWMYAYNAFVVDAVLEHWPIDSVMDVRAPVEIVEGLGFFYKQRFVAGGEAYNLYDLEREKVVGAAMDPRVHFVLNCASNSCPAALPELPIGDDLDPFFADRARAFVENPAHVRIDTAGRRVTLSKIFEWYRDEFIDDLRRRGRPSSRGLIDYLVDVGGAPMRERLAGEWTVEFASYDWGLNSSEHADG
jgi:hypothetical protein